MSALPAVKKIAGVVACAVGDSNGTAFELSGDAALGKTWIAAAAFACNPLGRIGGLLGLGAPRGFLTKFADACWVASLQSGHVLVAKCDSNRSATNVETALAAMDWAALVEPLETAELELQSASRFGSPPPTPPARPSVQAAGEPAQAVGMPRRLPPPSRLAAPRPDGMTVRASAVKEPERRRTAPQSRGLPTVLEQTLRQHEKSGHGQPGKTPPKVDQREAVVPRRPAIGSRSALSSSSSVPASASGDHPTATVLLAELRRALVRGQLSRAETISLKLEEAAKSAPGNPQAMAIPRKLIEGIASYLAGDACRGLHELKTVESSATNVPSLRWAALIWCARAIAAAGEGLEVPLAYVKSALTIASGLDAEARSISTLELAGVEFQQGASGQALAHTRAARALAVNAPDRQLSAGSWLLEARILVAMGKRSSAIDAAANARQQRPSWPAPATFIARHALREGRLEDASIALQPLLSCKPVAADVETTNRILECVRAGLPPVEAAFMFLELAEGPPTPENVRQLEALSEAYPTIDQFRDTYGWRLLRTGQYESARAIFEALCTREDLTEEVRSSVLLALGCLAAVDSRSARSVSKIRAAVDATPKSFQMAPPTPPPLTRGGSVTPSEFRQSDVPPPAAAPAGDESTASLGAGRRGPMFSGSLELFGIPDLLEFLRSGQRTGTLLCSSAAGFGAIQIRKGRITGAGSPNAKQLKAYLSEMGIATEQTLDKATDVEQDEKSLIGDVLVRSGVATASQVCSALRLQVRDAIRDLMSWGGGKFAFDPDTPLEHSVPEIQIEFDSQEVLLDIFKETDEAVRDAG